MARHIDYKATTWNRITVPDGVTDEQVLALLAKHTEPYGIVQEIEALQGKFGVTWKQLPETEEFMYPAENDNQETMAFLDNEDKTIWSNAKTKAELIRQIKAIIGEWGEFTPAEVQHNCIVLKAIGDHNVVIEYYHTDSVAVVEYVGGLETSDNNMDYDELTVDQLEEILQHCEDYKTDQEKTMERTKD
jgi:hypothetical protein